MDRMSLQVNSSKKHVPLIIQARVRDAVVVVFVCYLVSKFFCLHDWSKGS